MGRDVRIRHISRGDWNAIVALEADAYSGIALSEGRAALESRARVSPDTCFVLDFEKQLAGYVLAMPYPMFQFPDLTKKEDAGFHSRNLHLHDLVIAENVRGKGLAKQLLQQLVVTAESMMFEQISLVAVGGSDSFWSANGYSVHPDTSIPGSYGTQAVYMSKKIEVG